MKYAMTFIIGLLVGFILFSSEDRVDKEVVEVVKWKYETITKPTAIDTIYLSTTIVDTVERVIADTINLARIDTIYVPVHRDKYYRTVFEYKPAEFSLTANVYGKAVADSIEFKYSINEKYFDNLYSNVKKEYPQWKKIAFFAGGAIFTGSIFYLVK